MPGQDLTATPTAIANLTDGTRYYVQNRSQEDMYLEGASSAPSDASDAFVVERFGDRIVEPDGDNVYVWNDRGTGRIIYAESP